MKFSKAEVDAIIEASPRTFVPFNKLVLSEDHQARSATAPVMSLPELAASIKDSGVLQNLVVVQAARGRYEVCAGGRRLAALTLLVQQGDIADNYPVPVLVVPADKALIASLAENCFHVPMHPADEFAAFARLLAHGKSVEDVAAAFGVTPLIVKRRMKLATVSPQLMALYREGGIGLDCLTVLASVDDHQRQDQAWAGLPSWNQRPEHLRQLLTRGEIESDTDPLARFVTLKAYENAGGPLRRDLFSDDDRKAYLLDPALLERLAADKLGKRAKQLLSEGWKWVDIRPRFAYDEYVKHGELRKPRRAPTPEEAEALKALGSRIAALHEQMDALVDRDGDGDGDAGEGVTGASEANDAADEDDASRDRAFLALESEADGLEEERKARLEALTEWPVAWMALAGCVLHVGADGRAAIKAGLIRPEDRADLAQAITKAAEQKSAGGGSSEGDAEAARGSGLPALQSLPSAAGATARPVHSEKLMRRLTAHRVAAIQAELLDRPEVALAALTTHLTLKLLADPLHGAYRLPNLLAISATGNQHELRGAAEDIEASPAAQRIEADRIAWIEHLPKEPEAVFDWMLGQPPQTVQRLLTFLVASTVNGINGTDAGRPVNDGLARALGLDMTRWWSATGEAYLQHVSKTRVVEVVHTVAGAKAAGPLAALKKDAAVAQAEQLLAGRGWLPDCLRVQPDAESPATGGEAVDANDPARTEAPDCA
ncbi:ParB/RepB/Spo0J family partition protein [Piscinibacter koreensis]|jgi:ParB family transcriptional regulator, chromosome partitioning protein|uniref:ParB N-terminal domain-containing protein n=1 Tax=Piscinibacter koreensis TaxID=2742824 RepID=A0A7Y6NQR8_9BURK|nr:ParB/RepB/Spo0J family partition protein [Schlegelella koreensis]NUZ07588.1 ParB N-terminal domain-containing protein [Schlegelella koreensis]